MSRASCYDVDAHVTTDANHFRTLHPHTRRSMNKTTRIVVLIWVLGRAGGSPAMAQTPQTPPAPAAPATSAFIDVNGGGQTPSRTLNTSTSFPLFGETATVNAAQNIGSGPLF